MKISLELQPILKTKSGVGWYTYEIIKRLDSSGLELCGHAFNFLNRNDISDQLKDFEFNAGVCSLMPYGLYRRIWSYIPIKYNSLFKNSSDIYHFFNFIVPPKIEGKVIVNIYDVVYKKFPETMTKANYKRLDKDLKRSAERSNIIITISQSSKNEIIEYLGVREDKIKIVSPGIDIDRYTEVLNDNKMGEIRRKYNLPDKYILYLGTLEPRKNVDTIIQAFSIYKNKNKDNLKLVIAGGKGWMYESIYNKVKEFSIENQVIFTGYIDEVDKIAVYKMSEIFVFPSLYEGFGMPVLEAIAAGVPVITSNTSSLPEVIDDAGILVEPKDADAIAKGIERLLNDDECRQDMIEKGIERAKLFTWDKSVEKLIDIYKELEGK